VREKRDSGVFQIYVCVPIGYSVNVTQYRRDIRRNEVYYNVYVKPLSEVL